MCEGTTKILFIYNTLFDSDSPCSEIINMENCNTKTPSIITPLSSSSPSPSTDQSSNQITYKWLLILLIVIGVIAFVIGFVYWLYKRIKERQRGHTSLIFLFS
jgi:hypothetical protein